MALRPFHRSLQQKCFLGKKKEGRKEARKLNLMKCKCCFCHRLDAFFKPGDNTLIHFYRHIIHFVTFSHILLSKHTRDSIKLGEEHSI